MQPDKDLIKQRFRRCLPTYNQHASVQKTMSLKLIELIRGSSDSSTFNSVLDIGCGTGLLLTELLKTFSIEKLFINDLVEDCFNDIEKIISETSPETSFRFLPGDAENLKFDMSVDLIASNATLQWMADLKKFTDKCYHSLNKNGLMAFTTFGPENFREFRLTDNASLAYIPIEQLQEILKDKFDILHASEKIEILNFPEPFEVLRHLRFTGVTGTRKALWTREKLERFTKDYKTKFTKDEGVTLTYNPIYITARRR